MLVVCLCLGACTNQRQPAEKAVADIEVTLGSVAMDAGRLMPERLAGAQMKLQSMKDSLKQEKYRAVLAAAPETMATVKELVAATAEQGPRQPPAASGVK
jgi:hypothetical protein